MKAYVGARVLSRGAWLDDHAVVVDSGRIVAVTANPPKDADRVKLHGGMLIPGFIDTQVNGGGGVLLNDDPTVDGVRAIAQAHRDFGIRREPATRWFD